VFDQRIEDAIHEIARVLHGSSPESFAFTASQPHSYWMSFHDAFRADRDGRAIVMADGAINVNPGLVGTGVGMRGSRRALSSWRRP
jgi:hypothetical protein